MTLLSLSISHRSAPMAVVERATMSRDEQRLLADELLTHPDITEVLVLSTCNRTEVHLASGVFHPAVEAVTAAVERHTGLGHDELADSCDIAWGEAAVVHAFDLASGMASLVVGESQILGQVREAVREAQRSNTLGRELNGTFQQALRVGKRVHSETAIGQAGRSVLTAALDQVEAAGISTKGRRALVIGAGQMAGLAARSLAGRGAELVVVNRTRSRAERLVDETGGRAADFSDLPSLFGWADLVVTCVGAGQRLIDPSLLSPDHRPLAICDLAMPGDVDEKVRESGVLLVNLASMAQRSTTDGLADEVAAAKALVAAEVETQLTRSKAAAVTPTVVALRERADEVVEGELLRLASRLHLDADSSAEVLQALRRVANKLIHAPTVKVQQLATTEQQTDYADALRRLFELDPAIVSQASREHCDTYAAMQVGSAEARSRVEAATPDLPPPDLPLAQSAGVAN